jgi:16S rRNA (guanine527-N7)-methyltransferase
VFHVKHPRRPSEAVSRETLGRLRDFTSLLLQWNRTINLVSRRDEAELWDRHVEDSLGLAALIPPSASHAIDLGSGGGFPGVVLAIATGVPFHLVESDQRKAAFLREAIRHTGARATVHAVRAEEVKLPPAPILTARALAPLSQLLGLAAPLLQPGGFCLLPKGRNVAEELTLAATQWHMHVQSTDSFGGSTILRISEIARVEHFS